MKIMLTDMLEDGGCEGKEPKSAVELLLLDLCELLLPYALVPISPETWLFLVLTVISSRKEVR